MTFPANPATVDDASGHVGAVSRRLPSPLYRQMADHMRERILAGQWASGSRIPNEAELSAAYQASRITVRRAVGILAREGLLSPQAGRGTFVLKPVIATGPRLLTSFTQEMRQLGMRPSTRVLEQKPEEASEDVRLRLGLPAGARVVRLRRLRLADGEPVGYQTAWLPLRLFPGLETVDLTNRSLYVVLREAYGVAPTDAEEDFHALLIGAEEARLLEVPEGSCGLGVERLTYVNGEPFEYVLGVLRGDRYRVQIRLRGGEPSHG